MPRREQDGTRIPRATSLNDALFIRTLSYNKLPPQLLKLYVVKLDGSSFDKWYISGALSLFAELKLAVEEAFQWSPKVGQAKISWTHVWGYFCLNCEGRDLVNDKVAIKSLGIKDGDQLKFVRHMSIHRRPAKQQSKCFRLGSKRDPTASSEAISVKDEGNTFEDDPFAKEIQENNPKHQNEDEEAIPKPKPKLSSVLRGWFAYSKLWASRRKGSKHSLDHSSS